MISCLTGRPIVVDPEFVVLDVGGVGYQVRATTGVVRQAASAGESMTIHTWLLVREDALQLFGFVSVSERAVFERLLTLQGVGPKVALSIVSAFPPEDIRRAAEHEDVALFQSIPGIGPKVARRIVTELKDKVADIVGSVSLTATSEPSSFYDAREALVGLGMTVAQAERALRETRDDASADERVRQALQAVRS